MKYQILFVALLCVGVSALAETVEIKKNEYLSCFGQHDSTWSGYDVLLKKLSNGKVMGVLWKHKLFSKNTYTPPFELSVRPRDNYQAITYSSKEYGIDFTVYKDSYSGVLHAEAYHQSYSGSSELLCEKMDPEYFYFLYVDPQRNAKDTNLTHVTELYRLK